MPDLDRLDIACIAAALLAFFCPLPWRFLKALWSNEPQFARRSWLEDPRWVFVVMLAVTIEFIVSFANGPEKAGIIAAAGAPVLGAQLTFMALAFSGLRRLVGAPSRIADEPLARRALWAALANMVALAHTWHTSGSTIWYLLDFIGSVFFVLFYLLRNSLHQGRRFGWLWLFAGALVFLVFREYRLPPIALFGLIGMTIIVTLGLWRPHILGPGARCRMALPVPIWCVIASVAWAYLFADMFYNWTWLGDILAALVGTNDVAAWVFRLLFWAPLAYVALFLPTRQIVRHARGKRAASIAAASSVGAAS